MYVFTDIQEETVDVDVHKYLQSQCKNVCYQNFKSVVLILLVIHKQVYATYDQIKHN